MKAMIDTSKRNWGRLIWNLVATLLLVGAVSIIATAVKLSRFFCWQVSLAGLLIYWACLILTSSQTSGHAITNSRPQPAPRQDGAKERET